MKASFPYFGYDTYALKTFVESLGAEVILPPRPSKKTLELGVKYSPELICLPFKITLGNLIEAVQSGADTLFMAAGARKCRFGYYHYLQDGILRQIAPGVKLVAVSQYSPHQFVFRLMPEIFGVRPGQVVRSLLLLLHKSLLTQEFRVRLNRLRAVDFAKAERLKPQALRLVESCRSIAETNRARSAIKQLLRADEGKPRLTVALVGEIYMMIEQFANQEIEKELARLGVEVVFQRSLFHHLLHLLRIDIGSFYFQSLAKEYLRECPGGEAMRTVGEAIYFTRRRRVDGIVHIFPFTCMPENMALEALGQLATTSGVPVLSLSLDEHTSPTGLLTRLEAYVDLLKRRRGQCESANCLRNSQLVTTDAR